MGNISNPYESGVDWLALMPYSLEVNRQATIMTKQFLGLAEISLIGTDTYKYQDKVAFRYHFATWRALNPSESDLVDTDRFYVWADSPDVAFKLAVDYVYRPLNSRFDEAIQPGEGGSRYDGELDEQHREIILDSLEDWYDVVG